MNCLICLNCGIREKAGIQIVRIGIPVSHLFSHFLQRAEEAAA